MNAANLHNIGHQRSRLIHADMTVDENERRLFQEDLLDGWNPLPKVFPVDLGDQRIVVRGEHGRIHVIRAVDQPLVEGHARRVRQQYVTDERGILRITDSVVRPRQHGAGDDGDQRYVQ